MSSQKNTITINGKIYDTTTGKPIHQAPKPHVKIITPTPSTARRSVDGFVKVKSTVTPKPPAVKQKPTTPRKKPVAAMNVHRKTERPKTLMRSAVKNPTHAIPHAPKAVSSLVHQPAHQIIGDKPAKTTRTSFVQKSSKIYKFAPAHQNMVQKRTETIPVAKPPAHNAGHTSNPSIARHPAKIAPPIKNIGHIAQKDIFETALQNATSHLHELPAKTTRTKKRLRRNMATIMVILAFGGFLTYINLPGISLRNASAKAGFNAQLPHYNPTGYAMNKTITYQSGRVVLHFKSKTDPSATFSITQEKSNLDSASMLNSYLGNIRNKYSIATNKGQTVYIYNGSNATWVDGGVWYNIQGSAKLSDDQLIKMASSL